MFDRLIQKHGKMRIMTKEYAEDLIAAFADEGVSVEDFSFQKLKHMDRLSESDEPAIGYGDFTADLADALGLDAERPTYGGHGSTARARVDANYPKLVAQYDIETDEVDA